MDRTKMNVNKMKKRLLILVLCTSSVLSGSFGSQAIAQDQKSFIYKTYDECGQIESNVFRLKCFDTILAGNVYSENKKKEAQVEAFGLDDRDLKNDAVHNLTVDVVKVGKSNIGNKIFYLKNGQVWRQVKRGTLNSRAVPFKVIIKKTMVGEGFRLSIVGSKRSLVVARIK